MAEKHMINKDYKPGKQGKIVPDTSVIIEGLVSRKIESGDLKPEEILIHEAVLGELEHQANMGRETGYIGIEEIKKLRDLSKKHKFRIIHKGEKPDEFEIRYAKSGMIDSIIRGLAYDEKATLITADKVQSLVAEAKGIDVILFKFEKKDQKPLMIEKYFDETTMSAHIRENIHVFAKKGRPGQWDFVKVSDNIIEKDEIVDMAKEIVEQAEMRKDGFIEIERKGSTIVQLGTYRIVFTKPPFSDGWEITAVRPVKILKFEDYKITDKLKKRISEQAEGILIAGAPGHGKSTFAQALAEYYAGQNKIVKTVEAPRDLQLSDNITQYSITHGSPQEIHDILLLSRPDYTIFDEMRNTDDFMLFSDLRLSGVGMIGVVHGTNPVDALQRFIGRIELGVIPQVVDTVIFIKNGKIEKVLGVKMMVKVPAGMTEADLARPVVTVCDFETGKLEFEVYSYGEETVVVPVQAGGEFNPAQKLASKEVKSAFSRFGNVNLRALEIYEELEKEFEKLTEKHDKLRAEKEDVITMMNEIDSKKKDLFMKTFNAVNKKFIEIFSSLSDKGQAYMELEDQEKPLEHGGEICRDILFTEIIAKPEDLVARLV